MNYIPTLLQSSIDPTKISLTIESFGKSIAGVIALVAITKGIDPVAATQGWDMIITQTITLVTAAYTIYQSINGIYGLLRKAFVRLYPANVSATPVVTTS